VRRAKIEIAPGLLSARSSNGSQPADFESMLAELSSTFIRISGHQVDGEIDRWLRNIVLALNLDRSTVGEFDASRGILNMTHQWAREGVRPNPLQVEVHQFMPWLAQKILADELVVISRLEELPPEAAADVKYARLAGLKSNVTVPLKVGGQIVGGIGFATFFTERQWPDKTLRRLKLVAEMFGNALERKRATSEISDLKDEVSRMSRVLTMTEMAAALAHELNQPLGAILNNAQAARRFLAAKTPDLSEVKSALDQIVFDNGRAVDVIRNVRALFQPGKPTMALISPRDILLDVERIVSSDAARRNISLRLELPASLPDVIGERTQLIQVLINLIVNAFESISETTEGPHEVVISAAQHEPDQISVSVRDSGKGIEQGILPNLFRAFTTTKPNGTGMGLAISRSIIEKHGGRLWASQNLDRGATLEFSLPLRAEMSGAD
jgi:signal transduction histidine kinase